MSEYKDEEVFMIMGSDLNATPENIEPRMMVVVAESEEAAVQGFEKENPGFSAMSWPTLADMRASIEAIQKLLDGKTLPEEYAEMKLLNLMKKKDFKF